MQTKEEIEKSYETPDPWGYTKNPDDKRRKELILQIIEMFTGGVWKKGLDVCCGEAWITKDLPCSEIHGIEISDTAASRFPQNVKRVHAPDGDYGLILATGCLYGHYNWKEIVWNIRTAASGGNCLIVVSNIEAWEVKEAINLIPGKQIFEARFPYREFHQKLRIFEV